MLLGTVGAAVHFDARLAAAVMMFRGVNDIRYYINGINVVPHNGGVIIASTNGHQLALAFDPTGVADKEHILSVGPSLASAAKARNADRVALDGGRVVVVGKHLMETYVQPNKAEIDGKFPDYWRLIPAQEDMVPGMLGWVAGQYLERLGIVSRHLGGRGCHGVTHWTKKASKGGPCFTRFGAETNFLVLTMGMSGDELPPLPGLAIKSPA